LNNDEFLVKEVLASETKRIVNTRNGQNVIRKHCLSNYGNTCAACDINDIELLVASHIVAWAKDTTKRGLLDNVICFCVLHDKLFENRKIIINDDYQISFSQDYIKKCSQFSTYIQIKQMTRTKLRLPKTNLPNKDLLLMHYEKI
jgi:putative restriction endonuclease